MSKQNITFLNLPWHFIENGVLRKGIRAGSRWPFSLKAETQPGCPRIGEYLPAPYFAMHAAAWTQRACPDHTVILRDSIARYETIESFNDWWVATKPEFVVIETGTPCWQNDLQWIRAMKHSNPAVKIAVYGPPTRDLAAKHAAEPVDAWLLGEPDKLVPKFVGGATGVLGFDLLTKEDLASAPYPMFDEPVAHYYADSNPKKDGQQHPWPELTVWGSRGCYAVCQFCSFPATMTNDDPLGEGGRRIRFYSANWLEEFIRERIAVMAKRGIPLQAVRYDDDLGNSSNKHTLAICEVMRKIGLPWSMMCRADTSSREVWQTMKNAGCFGVKVGFESASDRIVNQVVKKKLNLAEAEDTCRFLRSIGMGVHTTWMLGNPTETQEERNLTLATIRRFYVENVHDSHQISGASVIDGTPLSHTKIADPNFIRDGDGVHKLEGMLAK